MKYGVVVFILICVAGCGKEKTEPTMDCTEFMNGVETKNKQTVKFEVNKLCLDLLPEPISNDEDGHKNNLTILVQRINICCVNATELCYSCISTYPPMSEIRVRFNSHDTLVLQTIDVWKNNEGLLEVVGLHD